MPFQNEGYRGGAFNQGRGSGADNYNRAIEDEGNAKAGALDVLSKIIEQSTALRRQQQMQTEERQFQLGRDEASRRHETMMRQLVEEGQTSRFQAQQDALDEQRDLDREQRLNDRFAQEAGDTIRTGMTNRSRIEEEQIRTQRSDADNRAAAERNAVDARQSMGRVMLEEEGRNRRNAEDNATRLQGTSGKPTTIKLPGGISIEDSTGELSKGGFYEDLSPQMRSRIEMAADTFAAKNAPQFQTDDQKKAGREAALEQVLTGSGIRRKPPATTAQTGEKHLAAIKAANPDRYASVISSLARLKAQGASREQFEAYAREADVDIANPTSEDRAALDSAVRAMQTTEAAPQSVAVPSQPNVAPVARPTTEFSTADEARLKALEAKTKLRPDERQELDFLLRLRERTSASPKGTTIKRGEADAIIRQMNEAARDPR